MAVAVRPYTLMPIKVGCIVRGIDLNKPISDDVRTAVINDVTEHRLLIFKDQGVLAPERHLEISRWFGNVESTFFDHPKSPHRDIFRVSNDRSEGCTGVGRTGWHVDGSFQEKPFSHSIYHIIECPLQGDTVFVPLTEVIASLSDEKRAFWERLYMGTSRRGGDLVHPHIYPHPLTKKPTMVFHTGMTECYFLDHGKDTERLLSHSEMEELNEDLEQTMMSSQFKYSHKWEAGDFIISDNLALGHMASPETQYSRDKVGLRVMHRVTIAGKQKPKKDSDDLRSTS